MARHGLLIGAAVAAGALCLIGAAAVGTAPPDAAVTTPAVATTAAAATTATGPQAATPAASRWGRDHFPNVELTDQFGRRHRLYDDLLQGRTVAVNTFFAGCSDVCPLSTAKMLELQSLLGERVGRDIQFYSISIDPLHDTPAAMKAYAEKFGVGPGWLFLTGKEEDIQQVTRKLGLGSLATTAARENHSNTLTVGREPTGQWMKSSTTDNPKFVAASMATFLGWEVAARQQDYRAARQLDLDNGHYLFRNGCAACHTIGDGDRIGPDLLHVSARRDPQWLRRFILTPDEVLKSGDPVALELLHRYRNVRMPNLGLARDEVDDLIAHIDAVSLRRAPVPGSPVARHAHPSRPTPRRGPGACRGATGPGGPRCRGATAPGPRRRTS